MANAKVTELSEKTVPVDADALLITDSAAGQSKKVLAGNLRRYTKTFYGITTSEQAAGLLEVNLNTTKLPGDVERYGTNLTGGADKTAAFQTAVNSGHPAFCNVVGTINIEGTIVLNGDKSLTLNSGLNLERQSGAATTPMVHVYGNRNQFNGRGATVRSVLYANPTGIILVGPALAETETGTTDVPCYENTLQNFKLVGPENGSFPQDDGAPGIYIHSIRRKKYTVSNPTYDTTLEGVDIVNCDIGIEFSTDANRSVIRDVKITQYKTAAVFMNAAYGNQFYGLAVEAPLAWTGGSPRYCIHLMSQNSGTETDTDVTYAITQAYRNFFNMYCELGSSDGRLMNWDTVTTAGGANDFRGAMSVSDGFGKNSLTDYAGLGTNTVDAWFTSNQGQLMKLHGWEWRRLDDDSGSILIKDSTALISGRSADMLQSFTYDLFSIDNVGTTSASVMIELNFDGKATTTSDHVGGKIMWLCPVTGSGEKEPVLISRDIADFGGAIPLLPIITEAPGTQANTGKFTVSIATQAFGGGEAFCSWDAKIVSSNAESVPNLDWTADVSYLSSSSAGLVADTDWKTKTKYKAGDESVTSSTSMQEDDHLNDWALKAGAHYKFYGHIRYFENGGDLKITNEFTNAPQSFSWEFQATQENTAYYRNATDHTAEKTVTALPAGAESQISTSGFFQANAATGGTLALNWAQNTTSGNATILREGSWLTIERLD